MAIPVEFYLEDDCVPTDLSDSVERVEWKMEVNMERPIINLGVRFLIPVFEAEIE